jgi:hypothetical protein
MGIGKTVLNFLFGKDPNIFDKDGRVVHPFSEEKWKNWDDRIKASPDFDWKNHVAIERNDHPLSNSASNANSDVKKP